MGRVRNIAIRTLGNELVEAHKEKFSVEFDKNKKALGELKDIKSKRIRNILAGYITTKMLLAKRKEN